MGYYDELLVSIESLINKQDFENAKKIIDDELKMPYVPMDIENKLHEFRKLCLNDKSLNLNFNLNLLEEYLNGTKEQALIAINQLSKLNIRNYLDIIITFLNENEDDDLKGILIDIMIEQHINESITINKDDLIYEFIPSALDRPFESPCFQKSLSILNELLMSYPSLLKMAQQLLIEKFFIALPLSYEVEESRELSLSIIQQVCILMDDLNIYNDIVKKI